MLYDLKGVSYCYTQDHHILKDVCMEIADNELILISGANGSGKTTLCRLLTGLNKDYQGSIQFNGTELRKYQSYAIADKVLYLKQEGQLNVVAATPDSDLEIRQHKFLYKDGQALFHARKDALVEMGLLEVQNNPTWELSSGQVKRIGLASLPLFPNHFWILDEPCIGLDNATIRTMHNWLSIRAKQDKGAMIIDHTGSLKDLPYHSKYVIDNGRIRKL
ncbi:MAG TPA: ATP-binding cassette domain-containing protein [Candidatus Cloacimonadota bacterium]|nr:ATP-binding cassette domain-containing protein [Candidatus Cloacimonadota bacterium]